MTDLPIGLTDEERGMLNEALRQLPELLAEAYAMRGAQPPSEGPQTATTPGSKPPCDLTLIACRQNIARARKAVIRAADEAGATLDSPDANNPDALDLPHRFAPDDDAEDTLLDLADLAAWTDWYAPCWWARNSVYIPLRQARTELRRLTRQQGAPRLLCPHCGGTLQPMDGATWHRCTMCETAIDHRAETAKVKPLTEHATNPALPAQATLYRLAKRGAITPIGHDDRGDLYHLTHILDAISNTTRSAV